MFQAGKRSTQLCQALGSAFERDRYQIRQVVEMSQISPDFGYFTKYLSINEIF